MKPIDAEMVGRAGTGTVRYIRAGGRNVPVVSSIPLPLVENIPYSQVTHFMVFVGTIGEA